MSASVIELEPESKSFVSHVSQVGPLDLSLPVSTIRELNEQTCQRLKGDYVYLGSKEYRVISASDGGSSYEIPVAILRPKLNSESCWNNIMIYFHGGGWTWSSRNTHMKFCEMIASECKCVVVTVEYRLSPEHKFPACYVDAQAVVDWCLKNKKQIANNTSAILGVAGDSAGANISASVCHLMQGIDYQVLIYPSLTLSTCTAYPSYIKYGEGHLLTKQLMAWFTNNFLNNNEEAEDMRCSPMNRNSFNNLPPALFIVAECDPLADQSPEYQQKLQNAGVHTELVVLEATVHGFVSKPGHFKETTKRTVNLVADFMSKL